MHPTPPVCLARFPLNVDMTDLILTTIPDIRSLQSFVLCSKFVYNVFNAHRASILRAVVSNYLGPATAPATRLVKVMLKVDLFWHGRLSPPPVANLPREEDFYLDKAGNGVVFTMREAHLMAANHDVVLELEALYSWRHKDPRSTSSRLTPRESRRFRHALYRLWLLCTLYGPPAPRAANSVWRRTSRRRRRDILMDITRGQVEFLWDFKYCAQTARVHEVSRFVMKLARWTVRAEFLPQTEKFGRKADECSLEEYLLWSGPRATLEAFQGKLESVIDLKVVPALAEFYEHFYHPLTLPLHQEPGNGILVSPDKCFLNNVLCKRCGQPSYDGSLLWSESNWSFLRGIVSPSMFFEFLDIDWWCSGIEPDILAEICQNTPYSEIVGDVFDVRLPEYRSWKPNHWLCMGCLQKFLRANMEEFYRHRQYPQSSFFALLM